MKTFKEILNTEWQDGMSAEDTEIKVCAKYKTIADNEAKLRQSISNLTTETAEWKRKYQETLSEEERKRVAHDEEIKQITLERDTLRKEKSISEHHATLLGLGYEDSLAKDSATALVEGDTAKYLENQRKFLVLQQEKMKADSMKGNPSPPASEPSKITRADFNKMGIADLIKLQTENPSLFAELSKS